MPSSVLMPKAWPVRATVFSVPLTGASTAVSPVVSGMTPTPSPSAREANTGSPVASRFTSRPATGDKMALSQEPDQGQPAMENLPQTPHPTRSCQSPSPYPAGVRSRLPRPSASWWRATACGTRTTPSTPSPLQTQRRWTARTPTSDRTPESSATRRRRMP